MKKSTFILFLIFAYGIFFGCSTSNDSNGNSTITVVPSPPTNLAGTVISTTQINLSWTDNSTNETGFKIERKTGTGIYAIVGTLNTDNQSYNDLGLTPNTTYTYRVYSYNAVGNSPTYSNEVTLTTNSQQSTPVLTTTNASAITTTTASSGGNITSDGGSTITARGVVWDTAHNPTTILSTKTFDGTGTGIFSSSLTNILAGVTYYVRSYAVNSSGVGYGNEITFTALSCNTGNVIYDVDGNTYNTVTIGAQTWMKENLKTTKFNNGDAIVNLTDATAWYNTTEPAWSYYNNDTAMNNIYGKLYNTITVLDNRNVCPCGFRIPSSTDWSTLYNNLGSEPLIVADKLVENGTAHWISNNTGNNQSGFTALPGGYRNYGFSATFMGLGYDASFKDINKWGPDISLDSGFMFSQSSANPSSLGTSIRCIKN